MFKKFIVLMLGMFVCLIGLSACSSREVTPQPAPTVTVMPTQPLQATSVISTPLVAPTRAPVTPTTAGTPVALSAPTSSSRPVNGINARLNEPFTLGWSQWATFADANNMRVFFTSMLEDTRCALDINCFQAGNVRVAVTVESGGQVARFDLSTRPNDYRRIGSFNGYLIQFVDVAPARERAAVPIQPIDYRVKLVVTPGVLNVTPARINEPFTLKLGQTIAVADLDTQVAFESVTQDSRCPTRATCATSGEANVVIALQRDGKTDRLTLGTNLANATKRSSLFNSAGVYLNALTPHPQNEFASKEIAPSEYQVTLVVVNYVSLPAPTPRTTTTPSQTTCADLSRGDATEILDEAIQEQPIQMTLFSPPPATMNVRGLCGYGTVAFTPNRTAPIGVPVVSPSVARADRAVIAGKLTDRQPWEQLLSIVSAIDAANPRGASVQYHKWLTMFMAGVSARDALNELPDAARGVANVRVNKVSGLGDSAVSVWREFEGGRYAALVAQKGETLFVITALVSLQRTEDNVLTAMRPAMQKMLGQTVGAPAMPGDVPTGWTRLKTTRFSILVPDGFYAQVPLRDVQVKSDSAQLILMGRDRETGFSVMVTESPLLFGTAQKKMENRKNEVVGSREPSLILKTQTGLLVNGRDTAILEYVHADQVAVTYDIVAGTEEFEIVIDYGKPTDANFIANAERIANSFKVDAGD